MIVMTTVMNVGCRIDVCNIGMQCIMNQCKSSEGKVGHVRSAILGRG